MKKNKKKIDILKAGAKERRVAVDNLNQKAAVFAHKTTKRKKTRQTKKDKAIKEGLE